MRNEATCEWHDCLLRRSRVAATHNYYLKEVPKTTPKPRWKSQVFDNEKENRKNRKEYV